MKETKTQLRFFTIFQWRQEEEYLRNMHKNGWEFVHVNFVSYHFKKCEPKDVVYRLDYNKDSETNTDEYVQLFKDCGWEYIQNSYGYSYFRKDADSEKGNEDIFCDDESRFEMMKRVYNGRMIPLLIMFFLVIIPNIYVQKEHPVVFVFYLLLFAFYLIIFIAFAVDYWKYRRNIRK